MQQLAYNFTIILNYGIFHDLICLLQANPFLRNPVGALGWTYFTWFGRGEHLIT